MSILEFISSIIKSIIWPTVILVITISLRKPIAKVLSNINKVSYNSFEMDFTQKLDELETNLETKEPSQIDTNPKNNKDKEISQIAQISPAAAITMAWTMVEQEINDTVSRLKISPGYPFYNSPLKNINLLKGNELIDLDTEMTLSELRSIRNKVAHPQSKGIEIVLSYFDAMRYYELAIKVINILKRISG